MKSVNFQIGTFALLLLVLLDSCSITKHVDNGQQLLTSVNIEITNPVNNIKPDDLEVYLQQRPNSKFFGLIPFKLMMYNLKTKWGEPPVILEKSLVIKSEEQLKSYLNNLGYYNSEVKGEVVPLKPGKAKVIYHITLSEPYFINKIKYEISDDSIKRLVAESMEYSLIKPGDIFNIYNLDKERSRVVRYLNDNGYFAFTKEYVSFQADTTLGDKKVDVTMLINNITVPPGKPGEKPKEMKHKIFYLNDIFIYPDFNSFSSDSLVYDTIIVKKEKKRPHKTLNYEFLYHPPLKIKPEFVLNSVFLEHNKKYCLTDAKQTYKKLRELQIYKYVAINFNEVKPVSRDINPSLNYLDCKIRLTRSPLHSFSINGQGTNSGGDLGIGGFVSYRNRNLFRGGEVFTTRVKLSLEARQLGNIPEEQQRKYLLLFNTIEYGLDANISFPKFLFPIRQERFSKYFRPTTTLRTSYTFQDQQDYLRIMSNATFGYVWPGKEYTRNILNPIDINLIKVNTSAAFDSILAGESERVRTQYENHLIFGANYSYVINTQQIGVNKNAMYFRGNFDAAGNLINGLMTFTGSNRNEDGYHEIFGLRYSQYFKVDIDFRYYLPLSLNHTFAFRIFNGVAVPYGNSNGIPYEKGFYGGGANGMRAWQLRYLGPGSYGNSGETNLERIGDIMVEANFEYRFTIYEELKSAFFYDVGNIWLLKDDPTFPGGKFAFSTFLGELAMDAGIGFRLDFSYFVIRFDFAQRLTDPSLPAGHRFVPGQNRWFNPIMNLGIGYPF